SLVPWLASVRKRALAPWTRWVAYAGELAASATSAAATAANSAIFREYIRRQYLAVCIGVIRRQVDLCIEPPGACLRRHPLEPRQANPGGHRADTRTKARGAPRSRAGGAGRAGAHQHRSERRQAQDQVGDDQREHGLLQLRPHEGEDQEGRFGEVVMEQRPASQRHLQQQEALQ